MLFPPPFIPSTTNPSLSSMARGVSGSLDLRLADRVFCILPALFNVYTRLNIYFSAPFLSPGHPPSTYKLTYFRPGVMSSHPPSTALLPPNS